MDRTALCPLCQRHLDPALLAIQPKLEDHIARILRETNPGWKPEDGACLECVHEAVEKAIEARSPTSLQAELLTPFPVYSRDEKQLLPTPLRVHANPNFSGRGITVAFLDSGFYPHPDLVRPRNRILCHVDATGRVPIEKQNFKKPIITSWHGLMTSAIGAGNGFMSNRLYRGLARDVQLVLVKTGNLRGRGIRDRDISRALMWVLNNHERFNIRVVNISLGGDNPTTGKFTELDELVEEAVSRGLVVVAAAGNTGHRIIVPPASAPSSAPSSTIARAVAASPPAAARAGSASSGGTAVTSTEIEPSTTPATIASAALRARSSSAGSRALAMPMRQASPA